MTSTLMRLPSIFPELVKSPTPPRHFAIIPNNIHAIAEDCGDDSRHRNKPHNNYIDWDKMKST